MDLNADLTVILKENVEFEILVDRIEAQCMRLEEDNIRLNKIHSKTQQQMEMQSQLKAGSIKTNSKSIKNTNEEKTDNNEQYLQTRDKREEMQNAFGKFY